MFVSEHTLCLTGRKLPLCVCTLGMDGRRTLAGSGRQSRRPRCWSARQPEKEAIDKMKGQLYGNLLWFDASN